MMDIEEVFTIKKISLIMLLLFLYLWFWSLLVSFFHPTKAFITPWFALNKLLYYSENTVQQNIVLLLTFSLPIVLITIGIVSTLKHKRLMSIFGDAHWATFAEIKKMRLLDNKGLILGNKFGCLLQISLLSHVLVFAPSRSGKGVSQVIPNALTFKDSLLVIDVKLEIFEATSGFRQQHGQEVWLFAPSHKEGKTHRFNILDLVNRDPTKIITDLQLITEILIFDEKDKNSMWIVEARSLAIGLLLWMLDTQKAFTFGMLAAIVKGTPNFVEFVMQIVNEAVDENGKCKLHPIAFQNLNNYIQKAPKEQSGVKSALSLSLNLWDDPYINAATSCSDFDIRDMRRKRMTIYLGIPLKEVTRLAPIMNLFVQFFVDTMTDTLPTKNEPYKILAILDEFCALKKMERVKDSFGFLAGYHVHLMPIIQNIGQFYDTYGGRDNSDIFFQNTDCKIAYRQNTLTDQEFISKQLGTKTVKIRSQSYQGGLLNNKLPNETESLIGRPLLSPDQIGRFSKTKAIALISGESPVCYKRIIYYQEKRFKERVLPPIDIKPIKPFYQNLPLNKSKKDTVEKKQLLPKNLENLDIDN